jgi:hypothetical protein
MARVTGFLQGISGKVGDLVYVKRGGKTYVRSRTKKRKKTMSPALIASQERFRIAGKISQKILSISELKHFWERGKSKEVSCYNKIFKKVFPQIGLEKLPDYCSITPEFGFGLESPSIALGQSGLLIDCDPIEEKNLYKWKEAKYIMAAGIILLRNPIDENAPQFDAIAFRSEKIELKLHTLISIVVLLQGTEGNQVRSYSKRKALAALITLDKDENALEYSNTFSSNSLHFS